MGSINVNGVTYEVQDGASVVVNNGIVRVNGEVVDGVKFTNELKIEVVGCLINLTAERGSVEVHGEVKGNVAVHGSVKCGNVGGDFSADGSVTCGNIGGNLKANGSVVCQNVTGSVKASGNVICSSRGG